MTHSMKAKQVNPTENDPLSASPDCLPFPHSEPATTCRRFWTWPELVATEPALESIARTAKALSRGDWRGFSTQCKQPLQTLVGWSARRPELRSAEAFDVAMRHVTDCFEGRGGAK